MVYQITKILEPAASVTVGIEEQDRESRIATINYESKVAERAENRHEDVADDQVDKKLPMEQRNLDAEQLVAAVDRNHQLTAPHTVRNIRHSSLSSKNFVDIIAGGNLSRNKKSAQKEFF